MKKILLIVGAVVLLAAGCAKVELQQERPTSPEASYNALPR